MKAGRPTKYRESFKEQAYQACLAGFTHEQLSKLLGVDPSTLTRWMQKHPGLRTTIKRGKDEYDSGEVENALLKRAKGFEYKEEHTEFGENGQRIKSKTIKKTVAPDTGAAAFWLKNRNPSRWSDNPTKETNYTQKVVEELDKIVIDIC